MVDDCYTTGDVARACGVSVGLVGRWIDTGILTGFSIPGSNHRRVLKSRLVQFLREHHMEYALENLDERKQN